MTESFYKTYSRRTPSRGYRFHLLCPGSSNTKMRKRSQLLGLDPVALSLSPFNVSGAGNVCPHASPGCAAVCLNYAGRGQMSNVQQARINKTRFWFSDRNGFLELLSRDLERVNRRARKTGLSPAARLNVFSDVPWERFIDLTRFARIQFYDYTKIPARLGKVPRNYFLNFSLSETNEPEARQALASGFNVAVPFRERPERFWGYPVIDGDRHDYRFLDRGGPLVVGLKPKGLAKDDTTGFVREKCAIYARVSTADQSTESQLLDLRRYTSSRGWDVYREYCDEGISGTKDSRPALNQLMADARKRMFSVVLVWRFDRFARSTRHLILALEEFRHLGIDFISYQENIDTSSPLGSAIFTIISAVAQLERDIITERVRSGIRRARANGKQLGRPRVQVDPGRLLQLRSQGLSLRRIARELGISKTSVIRRLNGADPAGPKTPLI